MYSNCERLLAFLDDLLPLHLRPLTVQALGQWRTPDYCILRATSLAEASLTQQ